MTTPELEVERLRVSYRDGVGEHVAVRDVSFDEDRSRVRTGQLPRNLACLSNAAISIVRLRGRFPYQPQAHRHYAARQGEALREVLTPL